MIGTTRLRELFDILKKCLNSLKICETSEFNLFAGLPVLRLFNILYLKIN